MMLFLVALLPLPQDLTLASTPEWKAYKRELAKHRTIRVELTLTRLDSREIGGEELVITCRTNGDFDLRSGSKEYRWVRNKGIKIDHKSKTWKFVKEIDFPQGLSMLGLPRHESYKISSPWTGASRMTRAPYRPKDGLRWHGGTGYDVVWYDIDAGFASTWWFSNKTHLVTDVQMQSLGPMVAATLVGTEFLRFSFDDKHRPKIDLKPPSGYTRIK